MTDTLIMKCECGSDTFRLAGVQIEAICTQCGKREPLGVNAFRINCREV